LRKVTALSKNRKILDHMTKFDKKPFKISIKSANCLPYHNTTTLLDLLATGFIISSNDKLQIYLLFIWSRRVVVETIFGKVENLYVAKWSNNHP
jgi:hypothetical protein